MDDQGYFLPSPDAIHGNTFYHKLLGLILSWNIKHSREVRSYTRRMIFILIFISVHIDTFRSVRLALKVMSFFEMHYLIGTFWVSMKYKHI